MRRLRSISDRKASTIGIVAILILIVAALVAGGFCWEYTIESWLRYAGKDYDLALWQGMLISIVPGLGQLAIPAAVVTWIALLFV